MDQNCKIIKTEPIKKFSQLKENIKVNYKYSLFNAGNNSLPPIAFNNLSEEFQGFLLPGSAVASLEFKVSDKSAFYNIVFDAFINANKNNDIVFEAKASSSTAVMKVMDNSFQINHVKPDPNGIIRVEFKRRGNSGVMFLIGLEVIKN